MTSMFQVTCHTPDNADRDRRIQGLGGPAAGGWYDAIHVLIWGIEAGTFKLWVHDARGNSVDIIVAERNGRKYLKTTADDVEPDNLLTLPRCATQTPLRHERRFGVRREQRAQHDTV